MADLTCDWPKIKSITRNLNGDHIVILFDSKFTIVWSEAKRLGIFKYVYFLKSISASLKSVLLEISSCILYTPINEHFGIVPLEAMSTGKPVIACNSGGPLETIVHGTTGILCAANYKVCIYYIY